MLKESEIISLDIDEKNDLTFKVSVSGASAQPSQYRVVCELDDSKSLLFSGILTEDGNVQFTLPVLSGFVIPKKSYDFTLEVIVDKKHFSPCKFKAVFDKQLDCVLESVNVQKQRVKTDVAVDAVPIVNRSKITVTNNDQYLSLREQFERKSARVKS